MSRRTLNALAFSWATALLTGCATGGTYRVVNATRDQIVVDYDRVTYSPSGLMPVIEAHCAETGKQVHLDSIERHGGVGTVMASCR